MPGSWSVKLDTSSGDMNEFAHGKGDTQFMNLAFNLNPALLLTIPYSTLGAGLIILPTKDPNAAIVTFSVVSAVGQAGTSASKIWIQTPCLLTSRPGSEPIFSGSPATSWSGGSIPTETSPRWTRG